MTVAQIFVTLFASTPTVTRGENGTFMATRVEVDD
jgi:hypothetical protein